MSEPTRPATATLRQLDAEALQALCAQVSNPDVARLVVDFYDAHPSLKRQHSGLYLSANKALITNPIEAAGFKFGRILRGFFQGLSAPQVPAKTTSGQSLQWPTLFEQGQGRA